MTTDPTPPHRRSPLEHERDAGTIDAALAAECAALRARAEAAEAEALEQARLLGMGGEREARLMGIISELEAKLGRAALEAEAREGGD
jgi:hypothetical protein